MLKRCGLSRAMDPMDIVVRSSGGTFVVGYHFKDEVIPYSWRKSRDGSKSDGQWFYVLGIDAKGR
jgi:hypothetical protein